MAHVVNRFTLLDWIYKKLGQGAVKPPITKAQLEDCIDESIDYYTFHAGGTGHEEQYAIVEVQASAANGEIEGITYPENCILPPISAAPFLRYKQEYQLPRSVVAIGSVMPKVCNSVSYATEPLLERGFQLTSQGILSTGFPSGYGNYGIGLWSSFSGVGYSTWGSQGGEGTRGAGGGADLISYELALEYMEMINQRYTIKMNAQFLEESQKVRFSPGPKTDGYIILPVWARVQDSELYGNIWIRNYTLALAKIQIAYNVKKYTGVGFPGGANIDGDFYLNEGKEEREKYEDQLRDGDYSYPPNPFYMA